MSSLTLRRIIPVLFLLFSTHVQADITETFLTTAQESSDTTGVWNTALHLLQLPLYVPGSSVSQTHSDLALDMGNGSDGDFGQSTLSRFDVNGGANLAANFITLTSDSGAQARIYQFTHFTVPSGITVYCQGIHPLDIRVLGDVEITGTINLNGGNAAGQTGGTGVCGGGNGGNGGNGNSSGQDGISGGTGSTGGAGGQYTGSVMQGGGGGGSGYSPGGDGSAGGSTDGISGSSAAGDSDHFIYTLRGGAGGGGGSGGFSPGSPGGGGGAGGGGIRIVAGGNIVINGTAPANGQILANGGNGANSSSAGAGGAGSGGEIAFFAGGNYSNPISATNLSAAQGSSGSYSGSPLSHPPDGGAASDGKAWRVSRTVDATANDPYPLIPDSNLGIMAAGPGSSIFVSDWYDSGDNSPQYSAPVVTATGGGTLNLEVAGASTPSASNAVFLPAANISQLNGQPYLKYRLTMTPQSTSDFPEVSQISIATTEGKFSFSMSGCGRVVPGKAKPISPYFAGLFFLFLISLPKMFHFFSTPCAGADLRNRDRSSAKTTD